MRITLVIHSLAGGGAERLLAGLASRLAKRHDVSVVTLDVTDRDQYDCGNEVVRIGLDLMGESGSLLSAVTANVNRIIKLRRAIRDSQPDVVLSFCDKTNVLALAATKPLKIPTIFSEHTHPGQQKIGRMWSFLRRRYYPKATRGIALTEDARDVIRLWTHVPIDVIPPAVNQPPAEFPKYEASCREKVLVSIGRLSSEKRVDRLIRAFAELPDSLNDWRLEIYGDGDQKTKLAQMIERRGASPRVRLCGWCDDVWRVLGRVSAFALTSEYEGFPVAMMEAMAAGLPCVAVDCESGPREMIHNEENGLLVPMRDGEALTSALARLLQDADLRQRLSDGCKSFADQFGWAPFVDLHEIACKQAIESHG